MWKNESRRVELCFISFKLHPSDRCFIQRDSWDGNRSIRVVKGLSVTAGVFYSSYSEENKGGKKCMNVEWLLPRTVSVFMRLSENLRLLIIWMLLPQETYICWQQRAPAWNHTAAGTGWTPALERQEEDRGGGVKTQRMCGDGIAFTPVILLNASLPELKLSIKGDATETFQVSDIWQKTEEVEERWNDTPLGGEMKREKLTNKEASLSTGHDGCEDTGALLRARAPSQEAKDGGARSCTDTWEGNSILLLHLHTHTLLVLFHDTKVCVCVSPATSRLQSNSHFEYPIKYMKLPEGKGRKEIASSVWNKPLTRRSCANHVSTWPFSRDSRFPLTSCSGCEAWMLIWHKGNVMLLWSCKGNL